MPQAVAFRFEDGFGVFAVVLVWVVVPDILTFAR